MFRIAYTKSFEVNPNLIVSLTPNLTESFSTLWFFFWDILVCKHCTWHIVRNILNSFTIATTYDIMRSWQISWFSDFVCFFYNLKSRRPHVRGRVSWTRCSKFLFIPQVRPHTRLSNINIIFHSFYYIICITYSSNLTYTKKFLKIQ